MLKDWEILSGHGHRWATDELSLSETGLAGDQNTKQIGSFQVQFFG